ncbi:PAS domain S-box protein [Taibaiella lutea]|uniref:histidine kinase n=1 Tax=Taibaiella lutea TaxID=2608001 RepID=A0A5M6CMF5_9BACT|nr:PAS domain-containing sensor histidine kinase [Taibaiella lutea]KAA5536186.1 PAS domain S-box protein [Taibaiella lutea]
MNKGTGIGFDALFSNGAMGIIVIDDKADIVLANPFLLAQFNYTEAELIGQPLSMLIPQRFHDAHENHLQQYNQLPKSRPMGLGMDLFARRNDGSEFEVEISLGHYQTDAGKYVIGFLSDISLRKEVERALKLLNEELEQKIEERTQTLTSTVTRLAQLNEETQAKDRDLMLALEKEKELGELKSRFVSMASHEFRTPLSTVLSSAYLISKYTETEDNFKREKHIERIVSSVNMLTDILNDFLSVGKIEEGKIQVRYATFDLPEYIESIIQEVTGLFKKEQQIKYRHNGPAVTILDQSLLKHIIMNLLSNAVKFSADNALININSERNDEILTLTIKDDGLGISKDDQQHLFERFFRGANVVNIQGTGLGLHIVAKYAELMNGNISCKSAINEGTTFILTFNLNQ